MKIGIEHRQRIIAGILITFAAFLVVLESGRFAWNVPMTSRPERLRPATDEQGNLKHDPSVDPTLHDQELKLTENQFYKGTGRNIFGSDSPIHRTRICVPPVQPPSGPMAEPLVPGTTLKFFGFALMLNQPPKVFLAEGDSVFVANEGDIVNRRYRVLRIDSNSVVLEDLIKNSVDELALHS
jgi:hypothetical protein